MSEHRWPNLSVCTWLTSLQTTCDYECTNVLLAKPIQHSHSRPTSAASTLVDFVTPQNNGPSSSAIANQDLSLVTNTRRDIVQRGGTTNNNNHIIRPHSVERSTFYGRHSYVDNHSTDSTLTENTIIGNIEQNDTPDRMSSTSSLNTSSSTIIYRGADNLQQQLDSLLSENYDFADYLTLDEHNNENGVGTDDARHTKRSSRWPDVHPILPTYTNSRSSVDSACGSGSPPQQTVSATSGSSLTDSGIQQTTTAATTSNTNAFEHYNAYGAVDVSRSYTAYTQMKDHIQLLFTTANHIFAHIDSIHSTTELPSSHPWQFLQTVRLFIDQSENANVTDTVSIEELNDLRTQTSLFIDCQRVDMITESYCYFVRCFCEKVRYGRSICENVLIHSVKLIVDHIRLTDVTDVDLPLALAHLSHVCLLSEQICLECLQYGGMSVLLRVCRDNAAAVDNVQLALRALAVLCSVSKTCVQLLSQGGLELVNRFVCESCPIVAVEAAGVLAQLTAPCHSFSAMPLSLPAVVDRLIDLISTCSCDSLLLCTAALANICQQHPSACDQLYKRNTILIFTQILLNAQTSIFVHEQVLNTICRMSANGYNQALIVQGGVRCLLRLVQTDDVCQPRLSARIRQKAAISLGTLCARGDGLKAVYDACGCHALTKVLRIERGDGNNPIAIICNNLLTRMQTKYQLETVV